MPPSFEQILHHPRRLELVRAADGGRLVASPADTSYDDEGAEIPDIPLRRSKGERAGTPRQDIDAASARQVHTLQGPATPNSPEHSPHRKGHRRSPSLTQPPEIPPRGRSQQAMSPDSPEHYQVVSRGAHSRSPPHSPTRSTHSLHSTTQASNDTKATSLHPLQTKGAEDEDHFEPLGPEELDPGSFDLVAPNTGLVRQHSLETRSEMLFSQTHLRAIFDNFTLLQRFTDYLSTERRDSLALLTYYLDATKALRAIAYANAIAGGLDLKGKHDFATQLPESTANKTLQAKADAAFEALARDDLPAYITHVWTQTVSVSINKRITGTLPVQLREMSEGLAEVFCLSDPSRKDNPIVFASEEFFKTTQYGMNYVIGRNCRFLQGPKTNPFSVDRIRKKLAAGKELCETFLNYRRDGSPFMNLVMMAPLYDSRGIIRYHIGAQVDVSGLVKEGTGLDGFKQIMEEHDEKEKQHETDDKGIITEDEPTAGDEAVAASCGNKNKETDEFKELSEMFNMTELDTIRKHGGSMYRVKQEDIHEGTAGTQNWNKPRVLIEEDSLSEPSPPPSPRSVASGAAMPSASGKLTGIYKHYLLVRPYPSLRILFASPSLRVPGILQSPFLSRIGGSERVKEGLSQAFADGHGVTAKIRWRPGGNSASHKSEGRPRWIHCTPLLGNNGAVGVWMIVLVDEEEDFQPKRMYAPAVVDGRASRSSLRRGEQQQQERQRRDYSDDRDFDTASLRHDTRRDGYQASRAQARSKTPARYYDDRPGSRDTCATGRTGATDGGHSAYTMRLGDD